MDDLSDSAGSWRINKREQELLSNQRMDRKYGSGERGHVSAGTETST